MAKAKAKKAEDLKGKTKDELIKALLDSRKEQFNLRFQQASPSGIADPSQLRKARRDIARIKTALSTQRNAQAPSKKNEAAKAKPVKATTAKTAKPAAKAKKTAA
jgi:large subunit ribosomal protein L29